MRSILRIWGRTCLLSLIEHILSANVSTVPTTANVSTAVRNGLAMPAGSNQSYMINMRKDKSLELGIHNFVKSGKGAEKRAVVYLSGQILALNRISPSRVVKF